MLPEKWWFEALDCCGRGGRRWGREGGGGRGRGRVDGSNHRERRRRIRGFAPCSCLRDAAAAMLLDGARERARRRAAAAAEEEEARGARARDEHRWSVCSKGEEVRGFSMNHLFGKSRFSESLEQEGLSRLLFLSLFSLFELRPPPGALTLSPPLLPARSIRIRERNRGPGKELAAVRRRRTIACPFSLSK